MTRLAPVLAALALLAACGSDPTPIEQAAEACEVEIQDGTLAFDTKGNEDVSGDDFLDVACVLVELGASDAVIGRIDSTRALDGVQTATVADGQVALSWSYHPDSGMFMAIEPTG